MCVCVCSLQLWRELLDGLVTESVRLRQKLELPENNTWSDTTHDHTCEYTHTHTHAWNIEDDLTFNIMIRSGAEGRARHRRSAPHERRHETSKCSRAGGDERSENSGGECDECFSPAEDSTCHLTSSTESPGSSDHVCCWGECAGALLVSTLGVWLSCTWANSTQVLFRKWRKQSVCSAAVMPECAVYVGSSLERISRWLMLCGRHGNSSQWEDRCTFSHHVTAQTCLSLLLSLSRSVSRTYTRSQREYKHSDWRSTLWHLQICAFNIVCVFRNVGAWRNSCQKRGGRVQERETPALPLRVLNTNTHRRTHTEHCCTHRQDTHTLKHTQAPLWCFSTHSHIQSWFILSYLVIRWWYLCVFQVYALMERMVDSLCDLLHDSQTAY